MGMVPLERRESRSGKLKVAVQGFLTYTTGVFCATVCAIGVRRLHRISRIPLLYAYISTDTPSVARLGSSRSDPPGTHRPERTAAQSRPVSPSLAQSRPVSPSLNQDSWFTWFYMVLHGFTWFHTVLHGFTWFYMVLQGCSIKTRGLNEDPGLN